MEGHDLFRQKVRKYLIKNVPFLDKVLRTPLPQPQAWITGVQVAAKLFLT